MDNIAYSISGLVEDPDVESITVTFKLKEGKVIGGLDSLFEQRALLKWSADHLTVWAQYVRDYGMKQHSASPPPIYKTSASQK